MDGYRSGSVRHLAALYRLRYDCIIGRADGAWSDQPDAVHAMAWPVSISHVVAAIMSLRSGAPG